MKYLQNQTKILLALLLFLTLIKGILWTIWTPAFQAPDENRHYLYIQYLTEFNRLPDQRTIFISNEFNEITESLETSKMFHTKNRQTFNDGLKGVNEQAIRSLGIESRQSGKVAEVDALGRGTAQNIARFTILEALIYKIFDNYLSRRQLAFHLFFSY